MNPEMLSRLQFALTASFHYIYPPISIGLGMLMVLLGILYIRTNNPLWRRMSFFWVKIYALVFAMGIATGVVQEFEFGMNWAEYSRYVGNIFGSLLAAEGVFAFFLEGGFLGLMLFGGRRLGPRMWLFATFMVAFGAHFSAVWIIMANSWMQTPDGYTITTTASGSRAVMTSFWEVMFTPSFLARIGHVLTGAWMVGTSFMLSVSAWYLLKKRHLEVAKAGFRISIPLFFVLSIIQLFVFGSESARVVAQNQPSKLAAMEGVWQTQDCAPMTLVGWVDPSGEATPGIKVPCFLSFLAGFSFDTEITGLDRIPEDLWPPLQVTFQLYRLMIALGTLFIPIGFLGALYYYRKGQLFEKRWLLWIFVVSVFLTELVTIAGWSVAEIGRQPWIVYGLMKTAEGISPTLTTAQTVASLAIFIFLYLALLTLFIFLLNAKIQHGPDPLVEDRPVTDLPDTFREVFGRARVP
jgi:cytochrome d ubiquinol oxidase subunit I